MEKRRLGKTGHMSTVLTFGGAALWKATQAEADAAVEMALRHGVNHFDVAPSYGEAELRLGPWMERHHKEVFLACKTRERAKGATWESIKRSLERLKVDYFDLFQLHAVDELESLEVALGPGGAVEAVVEAREQGLVKHIGITGHRPLVLVEAIRRFSFETVLFPLNPVIAAHRVDGNDFVPLMEMARQRDVGMIAMKAVAKQRWQTEMHFHTTWYEPFSDQESIDRSLWYVLSMGVTTAAAPSDLGLLPLLIDAAERYRPLSAEEQEEALAAVAEYKPIFPR